MKFILASASPRRRELLAMIGLEFEVIPSHVPEVHEEGEAPEEYVARLSRDKAQALAQQHPAEWVIAADTTVLLGDQLLEKPVDAADAARMLATIAGKTHRSEEHTSEPSHGYISYAVFCLKKKTKINYYIITPYIDLV